MSEPKVTLNQKNDRIQKKTAQKKKDFPSIGPGQLFQAGLDPVQIQEQLGNQGALQFINQHFPGALQRQPAKAYAPPIQMQADTVAQMISSTNEIDKTTINKEARDNNKTVLTIRYDHTGDMYHIKGAASLLKSGKYIIVIFGTDDLQNKNLVDMFNYFSSDTAASVYYYKKDKKELPSHKNIKNEGGSSTIIQDNALGNEDTLKEGVAPIKDQWKTDFDTVVKNLNLQGLKDAAIVNFRNSTTVHPELNTGEQGLQDLIAIVKVKLSGSPVLIMGHKYKNESDGVYNLGNYFDQDKLKGDRAKQAGFIRYLHEKGHVKCAVGMRSGAMDAMLFSGIPIIFVDTPKENGFKRTDKLLKGFPGKAHRAEYKDKRHNKDQDFTGAFSSDDKDAIGATIEKAFPKTK